MLSHSTLHESETGKGTCRVRKGWIEPGAFALQKDGDLPRCRFCKMVLSSAKSNDDLCSNMLRNGAINDPDHLKAWQSVDRADFCPKDSDAYADAAVFMGYGAQVSAPHVHARGLEFVVESLKILAKTGGPIRILEIGSGSGIVSAVLARLLVLLRGREKAGNDSVLAVEHISELVHDSLVNIGKNNSSLLKVNGGPLEVKCGDGMKLAREIPEGIDIIYSGCDFTGIDQGGGHDLFNLLKRGGRLVSPLGPQDAPQNLSVVDKLADGSPKITKDIVVFFTPGEQGAEEQRKRGKNWLKSASERDAAFHEPDSTCGNRVKAGWIEPGAFALQEGGDVPRCRFCRSVLSSGKTHEELCSNLHQNGVVNDADSLRVLRSVDRGDFCPKGSDAYADAAVFMGYGAQLSAPHVYARGLEFVVESIKQCIQKDEPIRILQIGSGSGIVPTLLAELLVLLRGEKRVAGDSVLAVDHIFELVQNSLVNIRKHRASVLKVEGGPLEVKCGDAVEVARDLPAGLDIVFSSCVFSGIDQGGGRVFFNLLKQGGRFVSPLGHGDAKQKLTVVDKLADGTPKVTTDIAVFSSPGEQGAEEQRKRGEDWLKIAAQRGAAFGEPVNTKMEEVRTGWIEPGAFALQKGGDVPRCRFCKMVLSSGKTNEELCANMLRNGAINDPDHLKAWQSVDRADFCPKDSDAYADAAVFMGYGAQVSAPHVHARGLEYVVESLKLLAERSEPIRILEIGSGSGIVSAVLAQLLVLLRGKEKAACDSVLAVEHIFELVQNSLVNIRKHHASLLRVGGGPLEVKCGDGMQLAREILEGIDIIYSGCDFSGIEQGGGRDFFNLLKRGGRFVSPLGPQDAPQNLTVVDKLADGTPKVTKDIVVFFTPGEQGAEEQRKRGEDWSKSAAERDEAFRESKKQKV